MGYGNSTLNTAKYSSGTDEWYTSRGEIDSELMYYKHIFKGKVVYCNCDDPIESEFSKYFIENFSDLGLKKLICTSYRGSRISNYLKIKGFEDLSRGSYLILYDDLGVNFSGKTNKEIFEILSSSKNCDIGWLSGDGNFESGECKDFLKISDIVVTNPPFSKFSVFFKMLVEFKKKFLIIGNQNALLYKEIFPYIKNNQVWVGHKFGDMKFKVPDSTQPRATRYWEDETGQKWRSLGNAMWLTNLYSERVGMSLDFRCKYDNEKHPKYDNFPAIHIKKVSEIPNDYDGLMGVPLTYIKYHDDNIFDIVGEANHGSDNEFDLFKPKINGKETYKRIIIRRKSEF